MNNSFVHNKLFLCPIYWFTDLMLILTKSAARRESCWYRDTRTIKPWMVPSRANTDTEMVGRPQDQQWLLGHVRELCRAKATAELPKKLRICSMQSHCQVSIIGIKKQDPEDCINMSPCYEIQNQAKLNNIFIHLPDTCHNSFLKMVSIKFNIVISSRREARRQTRGGPHR